MRRVAILSLHPLLRDALAQLLSDQPDLCISLFDAEEGGVMQRIAELRPQVLVVEGHDAYHGWGSSLSPALDDGSGVLVIGVGLGDAGMEIRYRRHVVAATADDLRQVIAGFARLGDGQQEVEGAVREG